ncbi:MAG: HNH endonuclease [Bacteroidales bacterium]|nr:HNH endonuclease [Bacteroidales bacterium]
MRVWRNWQTQHYLICYNLLYLLCEVSMLNFPDLKVYRCKDGRWRAVYRGVDGRWVYKSYPRLIMEDYLGRPLLPKEDVHHKDGNTDNNDVSNLEVCIHGVHQHQHSIQYVDKFAICDVCGKPFLWSSKRQRRYFADLRRNKFRIVSCSKECSSRYGRWEQLGKI